jgi:hypothetical protein
MKFLAYVLSAVFIVSAQAFADCSESLQKSLSPQFEQSQLGWISSVFPLTKEEAQNWITKSKEISQHERSELEYYASEQPRYEIYQVVSSYHGGTLISLVAANSSCESQFQALVYVE